MEVLDLGTKDYLETLKIQEELLQKRIAGTIPDTLIFVEHPSVYTYGRREKGKVPAQIFGVPTVEVSRGGKTTFHGPGQIVGYPIFYLQKHDIVAWLSFISRALIAAIDKVTGLKASCDPITRKLEPEQLPTGVWIGDHKVASIGIAVKRWVNMHGFALNVSTDLAYFQKIDPCGFSSDVMTSLQKELGTSVEKDGRTSLIPELKVALVSEFKKLGE